MKKNVNLFIIVIIIGIVATRLIPEYSHLKKTEAYVDNSLSYSMTSVAQDVFALEAILDYIKTKGYIVESDMVYIEEYSASYAKAMISLESIAQQVRDYDFQHSEDPKISQEFSYEYFAFFQRIRDLYPLESYNLKPSEKFNLEGAELIKFEKSHQFICDSANIMRTYYGEMDNIEYQFFEEATSNNLYKTSINENTQHKTVGIWSNEINVRSIDDKWLNVLEDMQALHRKK